MGVGRGECFKSEIGVSVECFNASLGVSGVKCVNPAFIVAIDCFTAFRVKEIESCKASCGISVECVKAFRVVMHPIKSAVSVAMDSCKA